ANVGILLFSNVAGVLADRIDRRRGLLPTQSLMLAQAGVLGVVLGLGAVPRARRARGLRVDPDLAPDRARAVARHLLGVRHAAAAIDVRALHCRSRRAWPRDSAPLDCRG